MQRLCQRRFLREFANICTDLGQCQASSAKKGSERLIFNLSDPAATPLRPHYDPNLICFMIALSPLATLMEGEAMEGEANLICGETFNAQLMAENS